MDKENPLLKKLSIIALIALGILLAGAFVFYKERILFADAAFVMFDVITYHDFSIQCHRYGSYITQIVPYCAIKLHLPLKQALIAYSVSFNMFYFVVAFILYKCRQYGLVILMAFYYFLVVSSSYFWTNNEIHQAVAWMFLFFGITMYMGNNKKHILFIIPVFTILALISVFTHLVVIIPMLFLWAYFLIEKKNWPFAKRSSIILSAILIVAIVLKYIDASVSQSPYESGKLHNISHFSIKDIINSFSTPVVGMFLYRCVVNYWLFVIVLITGLVVLIKNKHMLQAAWVFTCVLGYIIIMGLIYGEYDSHLLLFHIESEWASISIIAATAFIFSFLPRLKTKQAALLLSGIFAVRLAYIAFFLPDFQARISVNEQIVSQMKKKGITKLAIINDNSIMQTNMLSWGLSYETLMNSALSGDVPALTFFFVNNDDKKTQAEAKSTIGFYSGNGIPHFGTIDPAYFKIDSTRPYQIMTYEELTKNTK